ncbi:DUF1645 domain-containing protein [Heracleum sosnowskyi]|uniref:DUF1645 domain-containing protein n=1 Tax=Heracleum sosnowskyi TaxID=360622 RepID=A0AAD8JHN2_9APIA|nr:DUF1645 domain-containing protein [Heracleum sosnowskyi]
MQTDSELSSTQSLMFSHEDEEKEFAEIAAKISQDFDFKLTFLGLSTHHEGEESEEERDHNEAQVISDGDDDFSFVINGSDSTLNSDTNAPIRPYFPLFNRDLLLAHEDYKSSSDHKSLPSKPPVEKIFIQTTSSSKRGESNSETDAVNGIATGPYCAWEKTSPELSKKSNSTGFSKLWRFKEYLSRSHSDGTDAFVFLHKPVHKKPVEVKVSSNGEKKVVKKVVKKSTVLSSHEVYLRSKGIYPEHDKRRSYLPYKPEVVGFFTSVNGGGLSKNVHPY